MKNGLENSPSDKKGAECKLCLGTAEKNKNGTVEPLIHCSKCSTICKKISWKFFFKNYLQC